MDPNQFLINWLRSQSLVPDGILAQAMRIQFHNPQQPLFHILVQLGAFTEEQGRHYHAQATQAFQSQSFENSFDSAHDVTVVPTLQSTHGNSSRALPTRHTPSSASQSSGEFEIPVFEKYEIDGEISRGGMGVVFRARYKESQLAVALKVILSQSPPEEEIKRFRREAQTLAQIQHPGVVRVRDFGESQGRPYFAMDLVDGIPLKGAIDDHMRKQGSVPDFSWTIEIFSEIASALVHCHELNIIHRDLKPANILVDNETEQPVIVDFGLVKRNVGAPEEVADSLDNLTKSQATLGTPAYMAPEQFDRQGPLGDVDKKSDVWGFGATLYYALTGQAPYTGETVFNIYKALLKGDPPPPNTINPEIPDFLNELCSSCLTRNKSQRPTMEAIEHALKRPVDDQSLKKRRSRQGNLVLVGGGLVISMIFLALGVLVLYPQILDRQAPVLTLESLASKSSEDFVLVAGTVSDDFPDRVEIAYGSSMETVILNGATFSKRIPLKIGDNRIRVRAVDRNGLRSTVKRIDIRRFMVKAEITVEAMPKESYDAECILKGRVPDFVEKLECNGEELLLQGGQFTKTLNLNFGKNQWTLVAHDKNKQSTRKVISCFRNAVYTVGQVKPNPKTRISARHFTILEDAIEAAQKQPLNRTVPKILILERSLRCGLSVKGRLMLEGIDKDTTTIESKDETALSVAEGQVQLKNLTFKTVVEEKSAFFALKLESGSVTASDCRFLGGFDTIRLGSEFSKSRAGLYPTLKLDDCLVENSLNNGIYARFTGVVQLKDCKVRGHKEGGVIIEITAGKSVQAGDIKTSTIESCILEKNGGEGLELNGRSHLTVRASTFRDNNEEGILLREVKDERILIENCVFERNGKGQPSVSTRRFAAVRLSKGSSAQVNHCHFRDNFGDAFRGESSETELRVEDCEVEGGRSGMLIDKGALLKMKSTSIADCEFYGILFNRGRCAKFLDNDVKGCDSGIILKKQSNVTMTRSRIKNNQAYGILCSDRSRLTLLSCEIKENNVGLGATKGGSVSHSKCRFEGQRHVDKQSDTPKAIVEIP